MTPLIRTLWTYPTKAWRWLTSMRTALVLLFVLAIAAIPGTVLPQRSLNEGNVVDYIADNGRLAEVYDQLQLFDVFESTWFNAIFMLLTLSLIGCILPRSWEHYRAMKTPPPPAPPPAGPRRAAAPYMPPIVPNFPRRFKRDFVKPAFRELQISCISAPRIVGASPKLMACLYPLFCCSKDEISSTYRTHLTAFF